MSKLTRAVLRIFVIAMVCRTAIAAEPLSSPPPILSVAPRGRSIEPPPPSPEDTPPHEGESAEARSPGDEPVAPVPHWLPPAPGRVLHAGSGYHDAHYVPEAVLPGTIGGVHWRYPYYSYRRPWYPPGPAGMNLTIIW